MEICKSQQRSIDSQSWHPSDTHLSCLNHAQSECRGRALDRASVPPYDTVWTERVWSKTLCAFIWTGSQCHNVTDVEKKIINALCSALQDGGDLLVKNANQNVSITATDEYKGRVSLAANSSLLLSSAKLTDQRTFTCMMVLSSDIKEFPVSVEIYSEYELP